jgi:hypothetical protein
LLQSSEPFPSLIKKRSRHCKPISKKHIEAILKEDESMEEIQEQLEKTIAKTLQGWSSEQPASLPNL